MKKYFIVLLMGIGLMAMQAASAATLSLDTDSPSVNINGTSGTSTGPGSFDITITGNDGELVTIMLSLTGAGYLFNGGTDTVDLPVNQTYGVQLFGRSTFSVEIVSPGAEVPVPAAAWLFGSALLGLLGVSRRKSFSALAA